MDSEAIFHVSRGENLTNDWSQNIVKLEHVFEPPVRDASHFPSQDVIEGVVESSLEEGIDAGTTSNDDVASDVHSKCITDSLPTPVPDERGVFFHEGFLSYASRDCLSIPTFLAPLASKTRKLDLSYNVLNTVRGLEAFIELEELILDNNGLTDDLNFPNLPKLKTLSLNKNKIVDLERFVSMCRWKFPALSFLSLIGNACCPSLDSRPDVDGDDDYQRYRHVIVFKIPGLKFLDFTPVTAEEKNIALKHGRFLSTVKVEESDVEDQLMDGIRQRRKSSVKDDFSPLPAAYRQGGDNSKEAYGKCKYVYYGKQSEGNRFIGNSTL